MNKEIRIETSKKVVDNILITGSTIDAETKYNQEYHIAIKLRNASHAKCICNALKDMNVMPTLNEDNTISLPTYYDYDIVETARGVMLSFYEESHSANIKTWSDDDEFEKYINSNGRKRRNAR